MYRNPFTPSEIAGSPDDFFGRRDELKTFERSIRQGYVAIQGPIGIGKSSLLARARLLMEGFESDHNATSVVAVGHKNIQTIDDAARLMLESFSVVDETNSKIRFKVGSLLEIESGELRRYFAEGVICRFSRELSSGDISIVCCGTRRCSSWQSTRPTSVQNR